MGQLFIRSYETVKCNPTNLFHLLGSRINEDNTNPVDEYHAYWWNDPFFGEPADFVLWWKKCIEFGLSAIDDCKFVQFRSKIVPA